MSSKKQIQKIKTALDKSMTIEDYWTNGYSALKAAQDLIKLNEFLYNENVQLRKKLNIHKINDKIYEESLYDENIKLKSLINDLVSWANSYTIKRIFINSAKCCGNIDKTICNTAQTLWDRARTIAKGNG